MRVHSELLPDEIVRHSGLPRPRVTQTLRHLKTAGRISTGRPFAPPLTARDVARIVMALSAQSPGKAVQHEREIGRLRSVNGVTVEDALSVVLTSETASGQMAVSHAGNFVEIRTDLRLETFGEIARGFATFAIIPLSEAAAIGRALIDK